MDQWNLKSPLLYLWSRSDWTAKHKAIAQKWGHVSTSHKEHCFEVMHEEPQLSEPMDISPISKESDESQGTRNEKRARENSKERQENTKWKKVSAHVAPVSMSSPSNWTDHKNLVEDQQCNEGFVYRAGYGGIGTSIPENNLDEITKRCTMNSFPRENHRQSVNASHSQENGTKGVDGYGQNPYISNLGEYTGEFDVHQMIHHFGGYGPDSSQMGSIAGQDTEFGRLDPPSSTYRIGDPGV